MLPEVTPTFDDIADICQNSTAPLLPTASTNNTPVTGTWNPASIATDVAGTFTFTFTPNDPTQCAIPATLTIVVNPLPTVSATAPAISCNGGTTIITVTATGGTDPLRYSIDGTTFQDANTFENISAGDYTITVIDANLCTATATLTINPAPDAITAAADAPAILCNTGTTTITVTASGGTAQLQYSLDGTNFQNANTFNNITAGDYTIIVRDANGCTFNLPYLVQNVCIELEKTGTFVEVNNDQIHSAGDQVTYAFTVTNTGNVTLTNVTVTDVNPSVIISGSPIASLAPGSIDNSTVTGTYTLTQADIDAGTFTNTATVTGTPPSGEIVTDTDDDMQTFTQSPSLSVVKDVDLTAIITPGLLTYTIIVDNTGNTSLTGITITDVFATSGPTLTGGDTNSDGVLQVDETWTYTATYMVTQADIDAGRELVNLVIVDSGQTEPVQDDAVTTISQNAAIVS